MNVVDLMRLEPDTEHPHGLSDRDFDALFTVDKPVIFAYHGYPSLIHRLAYRRAGAANLHVRGYKEEGTVTTPFDMLVRNDMDRFHLVMDVIDRVPGLGTRAAHVRQHMVDERTRHRQYTREFGEDLPEVRDWKWTDALMPVRRARRQCRLQLAQALGSRRIDDAVVAAQNIDALGRRRRRPIGEFAAAVGVDRRRRAPRRARRPRRSPAPVVVDDDVLGADRRARAARAAAPARARSPRSRRPRRAVPARGARRVLRHRVPRDDSARRAHVRAPGRVARRAGRCGVSASTGSRTPTRRRRAAELIGSAGRRRADRARAISARAHRCARCAAVSSVDTTMGFTPLDGLVMATRAGSDRSRPRAVVDPERVGSAPIRSWTASSVRADWPGWPAPPTCARSSSGGPPATPRTPVSRSTSTPTVCAARSARCAPRSIARCVRLHRRGGGARARGPGRERARAVDPAANDQDRRRRSTPRSARAGCRRAAPSSSPLAKTSRSPARSARCLAAVSRPA